MRNVYKYKRNFIAYRTVWGIRLLYIIAPVQSVEREYTVEIIDVFLRQIFRLNI